jgi:hypothetical protein
MQMVWENDDGVGCERMTLARLAKCRAQRVNVFRQKPQPTISEVDRKEETAAGDEIATVCGHELLA